VSKYKTTSEAVRLLLDGAVALAEVSAHGVRVDKGYLDEAIGDARKKIADLEARMRSDTQVYPEWRKRYGDKTNLAAPEQLAKIVFGQMGYTARVRTETGERESASEKALEGVDLPFVRDYQLAQKLRKLAGTYLEGIRREMVRQYDGTWWVHPSYHLNSVITFRSSCSDPNWQNIYSRNPEFAAIVRRAYIPPDGFQFGEFDYGQIEVRIPCCYHADPNLIRYVTDPSTDMHRDTAMQLFCLDEKQGKAKAVRHIAKNKFVFPTFYGSYYGQCAPDIWDTLERENVTIEGTTCTDPSTGQARPMTAREWLAAKGITELGACDPEVDPVPGTFEHHVKQIEDDFWNNRFKVYAQWKRDWFAAYQKNGGFRMLTGFAVNIPLDRKQVCNSPIQGVAFHCTLWSMIRIMRALRKYQMRSRVIGEIHDCINLYVHPAERDAVIDLCIQVMTEDIKKWAPWLNVPMVVEPEICPLGRSWYDKSVLVERDGTWVPPDAKKWSDKYGDWSLQLGV